MTVTCVLVMAGSRGSHVTVGELRLRRTIARLLRMTPGVSDMASDTGLPPRVGVLVFHDTAHAHCGTKGIEGEERACC